MRCKCTLLKLFEFYLAALLRKSMFLCPAVSFNGLGRFLRSSPTTSNNFRCLCMAPVQRSGAKRAVFKHLLFYLRLCHGAIVLAPFISIQIFVKFWPRSVRFFHNLLRNGVDFRPEVILRVIVFANGGLEFHPTRSVFMRQTLDTLLLSFRQALWATLYQYTVRVTLAPNVGFKSGHPGHIVRFGAKPALSFPASLLEQLLTRNKINAFAISLVSSNQSV
mmetsp:Transcript_12783/g.22773  ORF Transcript_12783/g.22773 Transcript_12783/m.22773 type:complete len:220 (-) Transcript_12783:1329-1988(-)